MIGKILTVDFNKHICKVRIDTNTVLDNVFAPLLNGSVYPQKNDLVELVNDKKLWRIGSILLKNANVVPGSFTVYANDVNLNENGRRAFISFGAGWHD